MMATEYRYLIFVKIESGRKTTKWSCRNKRSGKELGRIEWYSGWRQYCYFPTVQAVYSAGCLKDIAAFMDQLKETITEVQE